MQKTTRTTPIPPQTSSLYPLDVPLSYTVHTKTYNTQLITSTISPPNKLPQLLQVETSKHAPTHGIITKTNTKSHIQHIPHPPTTKSYSTYLEVSKPMSLSLFPSLSGVSYGFLVTAGLPLLLFWLLNVSPLLEPLCGCLPREEGDFLRKPSPDGSFAPLPTQVMGIRPMLLGMRAQGTCILKQ